MYTYQEIVDALLACGFKQVSNNHGSHQRFEHKITGFAQPIPKHANGVVATGTAEAILTYAVLQARVANLNIANDRYNLSKNVIAFIKKQHAKIKKDIRFLVPADLRLQCNLKTPDDVRRFIKAKTEVMQKEYRSKQKKQPKEK